MTLNHTLSSAWKRFIASFVLCSFILSTCLIPSQSSAQMLTYSNLPVPGSMINSSHSFTPVMVKGLKIYADDPLKFDFILNSGNAKVSQAEFQNEGLKLAKYFLAGLTVPERDLWVNLSPYEKNRIIADSFGQTLLGRDLLAQDYILKQLSSSLIHPDKTLGKAFWSKVYAKAKEMYGTTNIPMNTFNKIWIVPGQASVWENNGMAFVTSSRLKVLSEEDYVSTAKHMNVQAVEVTPEKYKKISSASSEVVRQVLIPAIEKEINEGENFGNLRQLYNAMILAVWYKKALKESLLSKVYVNQNKITGVDTDKNSKQNIYNQYVSAFKKGAFNFIREDTDENHVSIPRKYFSGGASWVNIQVTEEHGPVVNLSTEEQRTITGNIDSTAAVFTFNLQDVGPKADQEALKAMQNATAGDAGMIVRKGFTIPDNQKPGTFTNTYESFSLVAILKQSLEQIPDVVVNAVRNALQREVDQKHILSFLVHDFQGTDIDIHVTHNFGELNVSIHKLAMEAIREGLMQARQMGLLSNNDVDLKSLRELAQILNAKYAEDSKVERGAESVVISRGINVTSGAVNIKLYNLFAIPGSTPRQKLGLSKAPGVRFVVRRGEDVDSGNNKGPVWEFEISEAREFNGKTIPSKNESISLLALATQPNDYRIVAVYPVEGGALPAHEPLATVVYNTVSHENGKVKSLNPTIIFRSQSGADAVGAIGTIMEMPNFVPGGKNGDRYVPIMPVSLKNARRKLSDDKGYFTVYGYQSRNNGQIPPEKIGILDHVGVNPDAMIVQEELAEEFAKIMGDHEWDQPGLTPAASEERVHELRHHQNSLFTRAPKEGEEDPVLSHLEDAVARGEYVTVLDNKADMGGLLGHTAVPPFMTAVYRASMLEAVRQGHISNGNTFGSISLDRLGDEENLGVGDDGHMIMLGDKSRGGLGGNKLAFTAFTRAYLFSSFNGMKPYGEGQDYQGPEAKAAKANPFFYSEFTEEFFKTLRKVMPTPYLWMVDKVYQGWKEWQYKGTTQALTEPFSGNVAQQGIGNARYFYNPKSEKGFMIIAGDKMGPPALNRPIREGVYAALQASSKTRVFLNGLVFEIWDAKAYDEDGSIALEDLPKTWPEVKTLNIPESERAFVEAAYLQKDKLNPNLTDETKRSLATILKKSGFVPAKRIFLDAEANKAEVLRYLADSDRFNVKHVWSKIKLGWDIHHPEQYLSRPMLGSSITRLGILTGGEYVGKDDPVMIGHRSLMIHIVEFLRTRPLVIQGDMNGSHWLWSVPTALKNAVATNDSHPIMVALDYEVAPDGKTATKVTDLTGEDNFKDIRRKALDFNFKFRQAQLGQFEPLGANERTVEGSYELAKVLRKLNDPDSPFLLTNKMKRETRSTWPQLSLEEAQTVQNDADKGVVVGTIPSTQHREGGIDWRPEWFDVQIERGPNGKPLPMSQQPIGRMNIKGFMPIPVDFKVINVPALLGINRHEEQQKLALK